MKRPLLHKIFHFIVLITITTSCSSNLDFNQKIGELYPYFEMTDIFNAEVFNYTSSNSIPIGSSSPYPLPPQIIPFDINSKLIDDGIIHYLKKVVFHATFINTTNNECSITVAFRTDNSTLNQYTSTIIVPPNTTKQDVIFYKDDIPNLKSITNILFTGSMTLNGSTIPTGKLSVNSDATIYL